METARTSRTGTPTNQNNRTPFLGNKQQPTFFPSQETESTADSNHFFSRTNAVIQAKPILQRFPENDDEISGSNHETGLPNPERRSAPPSFMESLNLPPAALPPIPEEEDRIEFTPRQIRSLTFYNRRRITVPDHIARIRQVLNLPTRPNTVDEDMVRAIARWQRAHQMEPTGRFDQATRVAMGSEIMQGAGNARERARGEEVILPAEDETKRKITAVVLSEAYSGQEEMVSWIYYNRIIRRGSVNVALRGSSAFDRETWHYKIWYTLLGGVGYWGDHPSAHDIARHGLSPTITVASEIRGGYYTTGGGHARLVRTRNIVNDIFNRRATNPVPGFTGQGNMGTRDFNNSEPHRKWKRSRHYYWLQRRGLVREIYVKILLNDIAQIGSSQVVMHDRAISEYFRNRRNRVPAGVPRVTNAHLTALHAEHARASLPYVIRTPLP